MSASELHAIASRGTRRGLKVWSDAVQVTIVIQSVKHGRRGRAIHTSAKL
jgi:hypothetical protein